MISAFLGVIGFGKSLGAKGVMILAAGVGAIALIIAAYQMGGNAERNRGEAKRLRDTIAIMQEQQQQALEIQTKMAERMADLRLEATERRKAADAVVETFRAEPSDKRRDFSDADLMRLNAIWGRPKSPNRRSAR